MSEPLHKAAETAGEDGYSATPLSEDQQELSNILKTLRHDPTFVGCFSLGEDGVLRSLSAGCDVVDATALSPRLIKAFLDRMPFDEKIEDMCRRIDGTTVPREQWFRPETNLLLPPLSKKQKEETMKMTENSWGIIRENTEGVKRAEHRGCGVIVRSNHNLETNNKDEEKQARTRSSCRANAARSKRTMKAKNNKRGRERAEYDLVKGKGTRVRKEAFNQFRVY